MPRSKCRSTPASSSPTAVPTPAPINSSRTRTPPQWQTRRTSCPATRSCPRSERRLSVAVITYRQALHDTLRAELIRDPAVFLMGEEIGVFEGSYKITAGLLTEFGPERVRDTPIAEEGFVGAAIGAAMLGLRPVVEIMTI